MVGRGRLFLVGLLIMAFVVSTCLTSAQQFHFPGGHFILLRPGPASAGICSLF